MHKWFRRTRRWDIQHGWRFFFGPLTVRDPAPVRMKATTKEKSHGATDDA